MTKTTKPVKTKRPAVGNRSLKLKTTASARKSDGTDKKSDKKPRKTSAPRRAAGRTDLPVPTAADNARRSDALDSAEAAIGAALDKKALMPVLIDVSGRASYTDFIAIVSGRSDRQVEAIAQGVTEAMKRRGATVLGREGAGSGRWTLLDFGDVIVHVFHHPVREIYDIEGLWIDAPRVDIDVPAEARVYQGDALYTSA